MDQPVNVSFNRRLSWRRATLFCQQLLVMLFLCNREDSPARSILAGRHGAERSTMRHLQLLLNRIRSESAPVPAKWRGREPVEVENQRQQLRFHKKREFEQVLP